MASNTYRAPVTVVAKVVQGNVEGEHLEATEVRSGLVLITHVFVCFVLCIFLVILVQRFRSPSHRGAV